MQAAHGHSPLLSVSYDERISSPSPTTPPPTQPRPMPSPFPANRLSVTPSPRFRTPRSITSDTSLAQSTPVITSQSRHQPLPRGACRRRRSSRQTPYFPVAQSTTSYRANHNYHAIAKLTTMLYNYSTFSPTVCVNANSSCYCWAIFYMLLKHLLTLETQQIVNKELV